MPTPTNRTAVRIARGTYSNLNSSVADINEGEICYATDQDKLYVKEGGSLVSTQADTSTLAALASAQTFTAGQRGEITTLTDAANISIDLADSNNFAVVLDGNRTLDNPTNIVAGQSGSIFITQDATTGGRTLAFGSYYDFAGGTAPTLSTGTSQTDRIDYIVRTSTSIHCVFTGNYS